MPVILFSLKQKPMKYLVPPIVIPILLVIGIAAYAALGPPVVAAHSPVPVATSQPR